MRKAGILAITIAIMFILASCGGTGKLTGSPAQSPAVNPTPGSTPAESQQPGPMPIYKGGAERAWRYDTSIEASVLEDTIQQGDCSTLYQTITTDTADEGLRAWLEGQINTFIQGVVQDTGAVDRVRNDIKNRGLEEKYLKSGLARLVKTTVTSMGAVVSIRTTDYVVDGIEAEYYGEFEVQEAGGDDSYDDEETGEDSPDLPECYSFAIHTRCLNMLERKPMKLSDLFCEGADVTGALNHALNQEIAAYNLEAGEVLKRPFTGIDADYPHFYIDYSGIHIAFNEDNPWFDLHVPDYWCTSREMNVALRGHQASPLLRDDSLAYAIAGEPAGDEEDFLWRYLPDFGVCEWETNGGSIRLTRMQDTAVMDKINAQIRAFETAYASDEAIMDGLFIINKGEVKHAFVKKDAYAAEMGNILSVSHFIQVVADDGYYGTADLSMLFDLGTGKKLSYKDIVTDDFYDDSSGEYDLYKNRFSTDFTDLFTDGTIYPRYCFDPETDEYGREEGIPVIYEIPQELSGELDWEKWGTLLPQTLPYGITEKRVGYIRSAYSLNGQDYIDIDYVEWFTGAEAISKAAEEGKKPSKYGYFIRNNNPMIRSFPVSQDVAIQVIDTDSPAVDGIPTRTATFSEWAELIRKGGKAMLFNAEVKNGWIVSLIQQATP